MPVESQAQRNERHVAQVLAQIGEANRAPVKTFIDDLRRNRRRTRTLLKNAQALRDLDQYARSQPIGSLGPEDFRGFFEALTQPVRTDPETGRQRRGLTLSSIYGHSITFKHYLRETLNLDVLPRDLRKALRVGEPAKFTDLVVLTQEQRDALLEARPGLRDQALLWVLWESGMRAGEVAALCVGSFQRTGDLTAHLVIPPDAEGLKTGPRTVPIAGDAVPVVAAWIDAHPASTDLQAPLFPQMRGFARTGDLRTLAPLGKAGIWGVVHKAGEAAGIDVWPHLFRHTRATRASRAGWTQSEMEKFFGWKPGSRIAAFYVHLNINDIDRRVRRDAGIDEDGHRIQSGILTDQLIERKLKDVFRKLVMADAG